MKWKKCKLLFNIHNELTDILLLSELLMILPHSQAMLSWAKQKLDIGFMLLSFIFLFLFGRTYKIYVKNVYRLLLDYVKNHDTRGKITM